jgi:hypothetical protein
VVKTPECFVKRKVRVEPNGPDFPVFSLLSRIKAFLKTICNYEAASIYLAGVSPP